MDERILFVDDEKNILEAIQRQLRKKYRIETALGPEHGLAAVTNHGPYAVIVSDLRMPGMDGIQFLSRVKEIAPDSIRMILTGNADLQNAIQAVNEGNIFRFLTKPCAQNVLIKVVDLGIKQYRLVTAERELLERTLKGSINVLTEVLSLVNPEAFGRSSRIKRYVKQIASHLGVSEVWRFETAAMLSQIGCVTLPEQALIKLYQGQELTEEEAQLFYMHPKIAYDLLSKIPRMQEVAEIITYQEKHFDGSGNPKDLRQGEAIPLGARILKVVLDFDVLETRGVIKGKALKQLKQRSGWYDPAVLVALEEVLGDVAKYVIRDAKVRELQVNMVLFEDVRTKKGQLLITRGQEVSTVLIERLANIARTAGIREPIQVCVPLQLQTNRPNVKR